MRIFREIEREIEDETVQILVLYYSEHKAKDNRPRPRILLCFIDTAADYRERGMEGERERAIKVNKKEAMSIYSYSKSQRALFSLLSATQTACIQRECTGKKENTAKLKALSF